jgi:hypothetical protein
MCAREYRLVDRPPSSIRSCPAAELGEGIQFAAMVRPRQPMRTGEGASHEAAMPENDR